MVDPQGTGAVAVQRKKTHQCLIRGLVERVEQRETTRVRDGDRVLVGPFEDQDKLFERRQQHLVQSLTFRKDPLVKTIGQEFARITANGAFQIGADRCLVAALRCVSWAAYVRLKLINV